MMLRQYFSWASSNSLSYGFPLFSHTQSRTGNCALGNQVKDSLLCLAICCRVGITQSSLPVSCHWTDCQSWERCAGNWQKLAPLKSLPASPYRLSSGWTINSGCILVVEASLNSYSDVKEVTNNHWYEYMDRQSHTQANWFASDVANTSKLPRNRYDYIARWLFFMAKRKQLRIGSMQMMELFTVFMKFTASPMKPFHFDDVRTSWDRPWGQPGACGLIADSYQW